ncbi:MAG: hypothetical protein WBM17_05770, partial [Anaerolineales bacterium]
EREEPMAKPVKKKLQLDVSVEKKKNAFTKVIPAPLPPAPHNGEYTVDFNKYIVVYSNNFDQNLSSPWRAGGTSIDCYKDGNFVGVISFYEAAENMGGGYVAGNGIVVIEYPIEEFENVMRILKSFNQLSLLFVERDNAGVPLAHRIGAVMSFQQKSIGS